MAEARKGGSLKAGAFAECPQGAEHRTGWVEPIATLGGRARALEGPCNFTRAGGSRRKAVEAVTRSLNTLEDRFEPCNQLLRQASLARSVGNHASGFFRFQGRAGIAPGGSHGRWRVGARLTWPWPLPLPNGGHAFRLLGHGHGHGNASDLRYLPFASSPPSSTPSSSRPLSTRPLRPRRSRSRNAPDP